MKKLSFLSIRKALESNTSSLNRGKTQRNRAERQQNYKVYEHCLVLTTLQTSSEVRIIHPWCFGDYFSVLN